MICRRCSKRMEEGKQLNDTGTWVVVYFCVFCKLVVDPAHQHKLVGWER